MYIAHPSMQYPIDKVVVYLLIDLNLGSVMVTRWPQKSIFDIVRDIFKMKKNVLALKVGSRKLICLHDLENVARLLIY